MLTLKAETKRWASLDFSTPLQLIGRSAEFQHIVEVLARDGDLLMTGVPGSGRRTLVRVAAQEVGAVVLEIDCIRALDGKRFIQLLAEEISQNWEVEKIQDWATDNSDFFDFEKEEKGQGAGSKGDRTEASASPQGLQEPLSRIRSAERQESGGNDPCSFSPCPLPVVGGKLKLKRSLNQKQLWRAFEILLDLLQTMAVNLDQRVVLILQSFPHIRSWDRHALWELTLRREIKEQTHVSYVLIATIAESSHQDENYPLETLQLPPLARDVLGLWAREMLHTQGLKFDSRSQALQLFLDAVQGHIGDAIALVRRLQTLRYSQGLITEQEVEAAITGLLKDLSITFESLLMLLPANQVHILESLALDPTEKPQSKEYIQKHGLSRGGSLQGALTGLQHKGLIYGADQGYQPALPLFALWLRRRLS